MSVAIRTATESDREWIVGTARDLLGDEHQVHSRRSFSVLDGEVLVATSAGAPSGFATWDHAGGRAEILAIAVPRRRRGVGRALVAAVRERATANGCGRLVVVTTDENDVAHRFYAATGFVLVERRVGAVDECRARYKPSIPPDIHDELEYATALSGPAENPRRSGP